MKRYTGCVRLIIMAVVSLSLFAGCATAPMGPTVQVLPAAGKPFDLYQQEVQDCKKWAFDQMGGQAAVDNANKTAVTHGVIGALLGTATGAVIGAGTGSAGAGAAVGAGAGTVAGTASGAASAAQANMTLQQLYDNAFAQCMYAKGNQVQTPTTTVAEPAE